MKKTMTLWENAVEKIKFVVLQESYRNFSKKLNKWRYQLDNKSPIQHDELLDFVPIMNAMSQVCLYLLVFVCLWQYMISWGMCG